MQPVVFSPEWFVKRQTWLLRLLAWPLVRRVLRRVLAIRAHDVGWAKPIVQLLPHAYTVDNGDGTFTTDFRTHSKYAKRLFYVLWPLWAALHAWDSWIANPWMPELNLGFDTLTVYPDPGDPGLTTFDGLTRRFAVAGVESFTTVRNSAGNSTYNPTADSVVEITADTVSNTWARIYRGVFTFDTRPLGDLATISSVTLSLYDAFGATDNGYSPTIDLVSVAPASFNAVVNADYGTFGTTSYTGSPKTVAGWATNAYNTFTLNATGLAAVSKTSITCIGAREATYDIPGTTPTWASGLGMAFSIYFSDQTGSSNDPKLAVTFTPSGGWPFLHLSAGNGISIANQGAY